MGVVENVRVGRVQFGPEDRALVRVFGPLGEEQRRRIAGTVARWAGIGEDRVLVVDEMQMDLSVLEGGGAR